MQSLADFTRSVQSAGPRTAVVLGSGQSTVLADLTETASLSFADVPGLPLPSVQGHSGRIVLGYSGQTPLLIFQGRVHFYEGHTWEKVAGPVRLAADLGIKTLLLTNAAGGIHPSLEPGSMMILRDHLFWQRPDAWQGPTPSGCPNLRGERPSPYSPRLVQVLKEAGRSIGEELLDGIYAAVTGPSYETPAEIRALRTAGADAVGMSTAYECETARSLGVEVAAISAITNKGAGLSEGTLDHHDVLHIMAGIRQRLGRLIAGFVERVGS
ncbi:MAG: purine-nucleoside phosphorylase [Planctomycetes bacterium]|nr:purine-nucleoside phosphorylase [Planctomycetota bacterium]